MLIVMSGLSRNLINKPKHNFFAVTLEESKALEFLRLLEPLGLPKQDDAYISRFPKNSLQLKKSLSSSVPSRMKRVYLNADSPSMIKITPYFNQILEISNKTTQRIVLSNFLLNERQIRRFLFANRNKKFINFCNCEIVLPSVPPSGWLPSSQIERFGIFITGTLNRNYFYSDHDNFENFVAGLANQEEFTKNLIKFETDDYKIGEETTLEILSKYGFS
ncbi:unnamed protein product [Moneuplotes crassus]|uniref:Uncharacterized protein n=1 Tax=Euplotes crassus TaxID=5936 RepID=A0AAD2CZ86_EUPCR|nr:unnamed protein product [Moneuplotes crassus]